MSLRIESVYTLEVSLVAKSLPRHQIQHVVGGQESAIKLAMPLYGT